MSLESDLQGKGLVADGAAKGPLSRVHDGMPLQGLAARESFATDCADEGPLSRVRPHVHRQVRALCVHFGTERADERLLFGVDFLVSVEITPPCKGLVADGAAEGLGVRDRVRVQGLGLREGFPADAAAEAALVVPFEVQSEAVLHGERFPADAADEGFVARVFAHVNDQASHFEERGFAGGAAEGGAVAGVVLHVDVQSRSLGEGLGTLSAAEGLLSGVRFHVCVQMLLHHVSLPTNGAFVLLPVDFLFFGLRGAVPGTRTRSGLDLFTALCVSRRQRLSRGYVHVWALSLVLLKQ